MKKKGFPKHYKITLTILFTIFTYLRLIVKRFVLDINTIMKHKI